MSRLFDQAIAADRITFTAPGQAPADQGAATIAALVKYTGGTSNMYWIVQAITDADTVSWGLLTDSGKFYNEGNFGSGYGTVPIDQWFWVAFAKADGSAKPRWHIRNIDAGTAWTHANDAVNVGDGASPATKIILGDPNNTSAGNTWKGGIAAAAGCNSVLSDAQIEAALTLKAADLLVANAGWATLLDQASIVTAATDITGHGGNQTAISGTTVDSSEPTGWCYSTTVPGPTA